MKSVRVRVSLLGVAGLVLSGCAAGDSESVAEPAAPEPATTVTVTAPAPAVETVTVEAQPEVPDAVDETEAPVASPESTGSPEATATPEAEGEPDGDESADAAGYDFGESETNDRGNLVKEVGQWAGLANEEGEDTVVFRVTDIETDYQCDDEFAEASENGQFVALSFEVETQPALANDPYNPTFSLNPWSFAVFDDDGKRENDSVGTSYSCVDSAKSIDGNYGPAETVAGIVVLDTGVESGEVVLEGINFGAPGGWAWEF